MEVTKIIQDGTGKPHACVFSGQDGGIEIEDLSIDCGFQNQRRVNGVIKCNASAIGLCGSHIAVRRCMVSNYGSPYDDECGENFAVTMCQGPTRIGVRSTAHRGLRLHGHVAAVADRLFGADACPAGR